MSLTTQQIHATADQLQQDGVKPTLAEVRKALGGGSYTTISEAMKTWRAEQQETEALQQVDLPSSIKERLQTLGAELWQASNAVANERLQSEREALALAQSQADAQIAEMAEAVASLEAEQTDLLQQLETLTNERDTANEKTSDAQTMLASTQTELADIKHELELQRQRANTNEDLAVDLQKKYMDVTQNLASTREQNATLTAQSTAQQAEIERLKTELKQAKQDIKQQALNAETTADKLTKERDTARQDLVLTSGKLDATAEQISQLTNDRNTAQASLNDAIKSIASLESDIKQLNQQLTEAKTPKPKTTRTKKPAS